MAPPSKWISIYLATLVSCSLGAVLWLSRSKDRPLLSPTTIPVSSTSALRPSQEIVTLAHDVAFLNLTELEKIAKSLRLGFQSDPDGTSDWLKSLSLQMAENGDHEQALELSAFLFGIRQVPAIERAIIDHWLSADNLAFQAFLEAQAKENLTDAHHLSILASVLQYEHASTLTKWIKWISKRPQDDHLRNQFLTKLLFHSHPGSARQLTEFVQSSALTAQTSTHLPKLAKNLDPGQPVTGLKWLASLDEDPQLRSTALAFSLADLAKTQPDQVSDLMQADLFLSQLLGEKKAPNGLWTKTSRLFYNSTLEATLSNLTHINPELKAQMSTWVLNASEE